MLGQRRRRGTNVKPASFKRLLFAGMVSQQMPNLETMLL